MKIALVHDYLTQRGGAERVFELMCKRFPQADVYTSLYDPERTIDLRNRVVNTTGLQNIPGASRYFRLFAPLYFPAFRALDLQGYDLILSSTTSFAKAVRKANHATHVCFCHNVTRFLWDTQTYLHGYREYQLIAPVLELVFKKLRALDLQYSKEPDFYIANSSTVAKRIQHFYKRPATTINYPIDEKRFCFSAEKEAYFLVSSRLLSYKRVDLIIEAFNQLRWPLLITGEGPEQQRLQAMAKDNIQFLGHVSDQRRATLMANARMVIVAALEDYGLVPIEANVSGTPVIAYGDGGVLDTQQPGLTGLFFQPQTAEALQQTLIKASQRSWNYHQIREHALTHFTERAFFSKLDTLLASSLEPSMARSLGLLAEPSYIQG
ncbi:MAG: glycosyltransferase [Cyanobacteria bacterium P01_H01_bin.58]